MLKVLREQQDKTLVLRLAGEIDESVDFEKLIGETAPDTLVQCREIARINSIGTKAWIRFFQERTAKGSRFRFSECSPAIVEQLNLIMNFLAGGTVESIYVPFVCTQKACKKSMIALFSIADLKKAKFTIPSVACKKCGSTAVFDDLPAEYFRFATR